MGRLVAIYFRFQVNAVKQFSWLPQAIAPWKLIITPGGASGALLIDTGCATRRAARAGNGRRPQRKDP